MIRCLVVDDEQHAIDILVHYIGQTSYLQLVSSTTNPVEALQTVVTQNIDLVFLDIQMPELSGIDFIKAINGKAKVILTTAYSEFAIEGFELAVVDYLLKPVRFPRFLTAVQKAVKAISEKTVDIEIKNEDNYIFVKTESKGKLLKINLDDIEYIEGMKNYVAIYIGRYLEVGTRAGQDRLACRGQPDHGRGVRHPPEDRLQGPRHIEPPVGDHFVGEGGQHVNGLQ